MPLYWLATVPRFLVLGLLTFTGLAFCIQPTSAQVLKCNDDRAVWSSESDGYTIQLMLSRSLHSDPLVSGVFVFSAIKDGSVHWTTEGAVRCSQGMPICSIDVPSTNGTFDGAIVENIDENADGLSEWIIFAGLEQQLYYAGGLAGEFPDSAASVTTKPLLPNQFKLVSCRPENEVLIPMPPQKPTISTESSNAVAPMFSIQIATAPSEIIAQQVLYKARKSGVAMIDIVPGYIEPVARDDKIYYRVKFSGFKDRADAENVCLGLREENFACYVVPQ